VKTPIILPVILAAFLRLRVRPFEQVAEQTKPAAPPAPNPAPTPEDKPTPPPPPPPAPKPDEVLKRTELPDGLMIEDLRFGDGAEVQPHDIVKVHYRGTLADGREFESSYAAILTSIPWTGP
jgi:hypothetical protein